VTSAAIDIGLEATETRVIANGLSHHVLTWGDAADRRAPIVLAHGFLDHAWSFRGTARAIARAGRRAIAFSWRGHGETDWIGGGGYYHFGDYVLDLAELLPVIAPDGAHLVGHSMGGTACAMFAGTRPPMLRSLVLAEGLGPPASTAAEGKAFADRVTSFLVSVARERDRSRIEARKPLRDLDEAIQRMRVQNPGLDAELALFLAEKGTRELAGGGRQWRFDPLHRTTSPALFRVPSFAGLLARIEVPVLLIGGEHGYRTDDHAERAAAIPSAREVVLEGSGHMMHWDAPGELAAAILDHAARAESA
jgi:pimeloyl-ACP methyl ester carboxylesterase